MIPLCHTARVIETKRRRHDTNEGPFRRQRARAATRRWTRPHRRNQTRDCFRLTERLVHPKLGSYEQMYKPRFLKFYLVGKRACV